MNLPKPVLDAWEEAHAKAESLLTSFDRTTRERTRDELQAQTLLPGFWDDQAKATKIQQSLAAIETELQRVDDLQAAVNDGLAARALCEEWDDESLLPEFVAACRRVEQLAKRVELQTYLSGPYDRFEAIFSLHAGQGGTEAMDWTSMLVRMYERYFDRLGWKYERIEESRGEEAGYKSVSFLVHAVNAYGYLKWEHGAHRLVRQSPFNADGLRQTSFSGVEVLPLIPDDDESIEIKPEELEWQFSRAGGAGGQNVNKVNTAVRLLHIPSGLVVECRQERSQEQNKKQALQLLKAQLAQQKETERQAELAQVKGVYKVAGWGNQIRNYVLHPYHLVKDTRTEHETSDTDAVLNGELDGFIFAEITALSVPTQ